LEKILINTSGLRSEILVGASIDSVASMLPESGVVIVTDENVYALYRQRFPEFPVLTVAPGEGSKQIDVLEHLAEKLLELGIDRSGFILGIGGGVVCDIAGFLSSIYMRGIRCGYVSSSLLSQVDASTGGKTGVNLGNTKNILGTIRQPEFVICDPAMLRTLSDQEYLSGLAELIKTAIIGDKELFEIIGRSYSEIMDRNIELLTLLVTRCVSFKASVVQEDEYENGLRRILNFGHTFGHAIELQMSVKHGFAVASGMELATLFSFEKGLVSAEEKDSIINILRKFGLHEDHDIPDDQIRQLILHDKKKSGRDINFVFTEGIGKATIKKVAIEEITDFYNRFRNNKKAL
jgi:3-dehydroquinate synthase